MDAADGQSDGVAMMEQCLGAGLIDDDAAVARRKAIARTLVRTNLSFLCTRTIRIRSIITTIAEMTTAMGKQRSIQT